ncbi:Histidine phosphatase superfamily [Phytophthora cactorum]|nr:Histidine phosphatase superfamily [Phytophthora cactorum]
MSRCTEFVKLLAAVCLVFDAAGAERQVLRKHMSTKTLNPTTKDITRINETHTRLLTARNGASQTWVGSWKNPYPKETEAWLADPGVRELKFIFEHTWKIRTKQSAEAFAFGFFDGCAGDEVLRFYDNCPVFETQIDSNKSSTIEHSKYRNSEQMHKNLAKFQRRTGFAEATQKDMEAAYAGSVFDQWCSFFDDEMLLSMDYFQDLSTSTGKDIFRTMKERVDGKSEVEGLFRFAHAETILPLASLLNVSYFDRHASDPLQRKFKSSELAPFAANIGFVLYECADEKEKSQAATTFKVKTLLNERKVIFNECKGQTLCPFDVLVSIFHRWIYEFDFQKHCTLT